MRGRFNPARTCGMINEAEELAKLQAAVDAIVNLGIPGASVSESVSGLARTPLGRRRIDAVAGVQTVEGSIPEDPNLNFRIGSFTKTFVATTILRLFEGRMMNLDESVEHYIPGLLPYGSQVSIRDLLRHTSGIPDYAERGPAPMLVEFLLSEEFRMTTWSAEQIVEFVSSQPMEFPAGSKAMYSNTNYVILAMIISRVTGQPLAFAIDRMLAKRCVRLRSTSFPLVDTNVPEPSGSGYSNSLDENYAPNGPMFDLTEYNPSIVQGAGNGISNHHDLGVFLSRLLGGTILHQHVMAVMKTTVPNETPDWTPGIEFGMGIWKFDVDETTTIWGHEGEIPGSHLFAFGDERGSRIITLQTNLMLPSYEVLAQVFDIYKSLWM